MARATKDRDDAEEQLAERIRSALHLSDELNFSFVGIRLSEALDALAYARDHRSHAED